MGLQVIVNTSREIKPFIATVKFQRSRLVHILATISPHSLKIVDNVRSVLKITDSAFTQNEQVDYSRVKVLVEAGERYCCLIKLSHFCICSGGEFSKYEV